MTCTDCGRARLTVRVGGRCRRCWTSSTGPALTKTGKVAHLPPTPALDRLIASRS